MTLSKNIQFKIRELKQNGRADSVVARELEISPTAVKKYAQMLGYKYPAKEYCLFCGEKLPLTNGKRHKKFCNTQCRYAWWNENRDKKKHYNFVCEWCREPFSSYIIKIKYCSIQCGVKGARRGRIERAHKEIENGTKKCRLCGEIKPIKEFHRVSRAANGLKSYCKRCCSQKWKEYISRPGFKRKPRTLERRLKERELKKTKEYKDKKNQWEREMAASTPSFRLHRSVKCRIWMSLKDSKAGQSVFKLLGYTLEDLVKHLERQFQPGMSWGNYGEWHIDHITPILAFNFSHPEHIDFKRCWALSNLRPMWGKENMAKHTKLIKDFQPALGF